MMVADSALDLHACIRESLSWETQVSRVPDHAVTIVILVGNISICSANEQFMVEEGRTFSHEAALSPTMHPH